MLIRSSLEGNLEDRLKGRLILLAGDSNISRSFRDDMYKHFREDHQFGTRAVRLDSEIVDYSNGELNFRIFSPDEALSMDQITTMLRTGDTYIVTKLDNPELKDPLQYHVDGLVNLLGQKYLELTTTRGLRTEDIQHRFLNYTAIQIGKILHNVVEERVLERRLWEITQTLFSWCKHFETALRYQTEHPERGAEQPGLEMEFQLDLLRRAVNGYLNEIVEQRPKTIALEELRGLSSRIGRQIIQPNDVGRISWITPFLDLRSDHNRIDPHEGIRVEELADHAQLYGVRRITMLRAHSHAGMKFFLDRGIEVDNLTQTNEYISMLVQLIPDFRNTYVLSPDRGGIEDAMVFARELYRRTRGQFSGRVVVLDKKRAAPGEIKTMKFLGSFVYNPDKDAEKGVVDNAGNPMPYDHVTTHGAHYKDKGHASYIGHLFNEEFTEQQGEQLKATIQSHRTLIRDDLIASGGTMISAAEFAHREYQSTSMALIEHPCFTGDAIEKLNEAHAEGKGYLTALVTSNSIIHPNGQERPWHIQRSLSRRFQAAVRRQYKAFAREHYPDFYRRLEQFDARGME